MSNKEKNYKKIMIITIVTSIIVVLGTVSYAFYQTAINGTVSGTIAKWSFTANNQTDSFDLNLGELYPGKSGTYNITLSATNSDLDVYYELIFTSANINKFMYWDSSYTKPLSSSDASYDGSYVGKYGVITKGSSVTIPLYFNWPYDNPYDDNGVDYYYYNESLSIPEIKIIAKQYTGYSGSIPMNLLGFTNLISYNEIGNGLVIPIKTSSDQYGYGQNYKFEAINSTSGYILNGSF
ncbi:MAG: hypothetical protein MR265_03410 [Erysipelotrichaceae bacterium]|nr:hypothetical protein [Erysipelotrichaceae bacterium]